MADAMVTARMTQEKKEAGNRVLESLGMNPSQMINQLYDYLIEKRKSPLAKEQKPKKHTPEEWQVAMEFIESIPEESRFSHMTDDEIRQERLISRGLATEEDFA